MKSFQSGAENINRIGDVLHIHASTDDVTVAIRKQASSMPTIKSVIMVDGALPNEAVREELCNEDCGSQSESVELLIGGVNAREGAWPWNSGNNNKNRLLAVGNLFCSNLLQTNSFGIKFSLLCNNHQ